MSYPINQKMEIYEGFWKAQDKHEIKSISEYARLVGVSRQTITRWLNSINYDEYIEWCQNTEN